MNRAHEAAIAEGATAEQADQFALAALGDARTVNGHYRQVLLTSDEARLLRNGNSEARAFCSRRWIKWTGIVLSVGTFWTALTLFFLGRIEMSASRACHLPDDWSSLCCAASSRLHAVTQSYLSRREVCADHWRARDGFRSRFAAHVVAADLVLVADRRGSNGGELSIRRKLPATAWPRQLVSLI